MKIGISGIVVMEGNQFIGIDTGSGGYPYLTDFHNAHIFENVKSALSYRLSSSVGHEWKLYRLSNVEVDAINVERELLDQYNREHEKLKEKYGITD